MTFKDLITYILAQFLGGIVAAALLSVMLGGSIEGYDVVATGLGQNGWGPGYLGEFTLGSAIIFEFVATFLFLVTILGSTQGGAPTHMAGLAIGICLAVIHIFGIQITGVSVNPARSLGPALMVGGQALAQVWVFLIVPSAAGIVAGFLFRSGLLEADPVK